MKLPPILTMSLLMLLLTIQGALAVDSTNPTDYIIYDDAESGTPSGNNWSYTGTGSGTITYSTDYGANGSAHSIKSTTTGTGQAIRPFNGGGTFSYTNVTLDFNFFTNTTKSYEYFGWGDASAAAGTHSNIGRNTVISATNYFCDNDNTGTKDSTVSIGAGWHSGKIQAINPTLTVFWVDGVNGMNETNNQNAVPMRITNYILTGGGETVYWDNIRLYNGTTPPQAAGASQPSTPTWAAPTPGDGSRNNTQVTLNATSTSPGVSYYLWFDNTTNPTTLVLNNATLGNWTTNVTTQAVYYYKAGVWNSTGNFSANSTVRTWTYDTTTPTITINNGNEWNSTNSTKENVYDGIVKLNFTLADNLALYGFIANITRGSTVYYNLTNTTLNNATSALITRNVTATTWPAGVYNASITVADTHTAQAISNYQVTSKKSSITFKPSNDNNIKVETREPSTITATKLTDRYTFRMVYDDLSTKNRTYDVKTDLCKLDYLPMSAYKAHFVTWCNGGGNWIDFEGLPGTPVVTRIDDYHYTVTLKDVPPDVTFQSIGGLNEYTANYTFILWTNSLNITILDEDQIIPINWTNVSVTTRQAGTTYTNTTSNANIIFSNLTTGSWYVELRANGFHTRSYTVTTNDTSMTQLTAYLGQNSSEVIMQFVDSISSSIALQDVSVTQSREINGTWTTISNKLTDITGRTVFGYRDDVAYRFTADKNGYLNKTFDLNPVLFDSYTVKMTKSTSLNDTTTYRGVSHNYQPNIFYDGQQNQVNITFNSVLNTLNNYTYLLTYPGGSKTGTGTNPSGQTFTVDFNITGSQPLDKANLTMTYTTTSGGNRTYQYANTILITPGNTTMIANKDQTYGMGLLERALIGTIIIIIAGGLITIAAGPVTGALMALLLMGVFIKIGFWEWWLAGLSFLVGFALIAARSD